MSKLLTALVFSSVVLAPATSYAQAEAANHGQCVSTYNKTTQLAEGQTRQEYNAARKEACPPPGQAKKEGGGTGGT